VQDEAVEADVDRDQASKTPGAAGAAIEQLYRDQGIRLWRALVLTTASPDVADDAVGEAFAQALRRGEGLRNPAGWVWRAAFSIAAGEMKERRRMVPLDVGVDVAAVVRGVSPERLIDLVRALARLTYRQRVSVVLADYAGWSHRQIAHVLGVSVATVGVHVHRARGRLRELLEDHDG
jgi:DNA-directed RNA polymerase specialized sigma24 family protein